MDCDWDECAWNVGIWDDSTTNSDYGSNIPVWCATKYFKVGEPGSVKSLKRLYPEILYPQTFGGTITVQTDYQLLEAFNTSVFSSNPSGALWDAAVWDNAFWQALPTQLSSFNAPASRVDVYTLLPNNIGNFLVWNVGSWNRAPWGSNPLPSIQAPGIQGEAFSFGVQTNVQTSGSIWDQSKWDESSWGTGDQLPWTFSGISGSYSQNAKR
jgi:hypothetical protein